MLIKEGMTLEDIITTNAKRFVDFARNKIDDYDHLNNWYQNKSSEKLFDEYLNAVASVAFLVSISDVEALTKDKIENNVDILARDLLQNNLWPEVLYIIDNDKRYKGFFYNCRFFLDDKGVITKTEFINALPAIENKPIRYFHQEFDKLFIGSHVTTAKIFLEQMGLIKRNWNINKEIEKQTLWETIHVEFIQSIMASICSLYYHEHYDEIIYYNTHTNTIKKLCSSLSDIYDLDGYDAAIIFDIFKDECDIRTNETIRKLSYEP